MQSLRVSADEFARKTRPRGERQSRLAPFDAELRTLRTKGYGLDQLREFLKENGVTVTVATVSAYLRKKQDQS